MELKNFAIISGEDAIIEKGHIKLPAPKKTTDEKNEKYRSHTTVRSDVYFSNGTIEFKFKTNNYETGIVAIFETSKKDEGLAIGFSRNLDCFLISNNPHSLEPLVKAGSLKNYKLNEEHVIRIEVIGSVVKLFMDNVLLCITNTTIKGSMLEFRIASNGSLEVYDIKAHIMKPKVFVVMQFTKEYNELFNDVIKPITEKAGYECIRADEFYTSTPILRDIIENIEGSTAIIAEITPDNPNVFYEIGYSHAINKPTILLCDTKREKLPFDLSSFRTLFYENTIAGKKKVEENLAKYLENIK